MNLEFLVMDQYAVYVWSTYTITLCIFAKILLATFKEKIQIKQRILNFYKQTPNEPQS